MGLLGKPRPAGEAGSGRTHPAAQHRPLPRGPAQAQTSFLGQAEERG